VETACARWCGDSVYDAEWTKQNTCCLFVRIYVFVMVPVLGRLGRPAKAGDVLVGVCEFTGFTTADIVVLIVVSSYRWVCQANQP
jgi:hypothetical protein